MKKIHNSFHFIYGVIIGVLICACSGQSESNSNTTAQNSSSTIEFPKSMDVRVVGWTTDATIDVDVQGFQGTQFNSSFSSAGGGSAGFPVIVLNK